MSKNLLILLFSSIVISACGGGGGGNGGSGASPVQSYSYDKTASQYTNKTWQIDTSVRSLRTTSSEWSWENYTSKDDPDSGVMVEFIEGDEYLTINLSFQLYFSGNANQSYNLRLTTIDSSNYPIIDSSNNIIAAWVEDDYSFKGRGFINTIFAHPDYLASLNIEHTNVGFIDVFRTDLHSMSRDTFAFNYGSITYQGDMPTSGTASYSIYTEGILSAYYNEDYYDELAIYRGNGSLTANFSSNKISGSLTLDSFYDYSFYLEYGAVSRSQISFNPITVTFNEGSILGNSFSNYLTVTSQDWSGYGGDGVSQGSFFGPNGKEISGTYTLTTDETDQSGLFDWDFIGAFYGTCKNSGC